MILLLKLNRYFQNVFMIIRLKYFYESLNIEVIVAPGPEFAYAKFAQFPFKI